MNQFDVIRFLNDYNIPWWGRGENVSRGRVGVTCPFCDDHYNHLGLDKKGQKTPYCWKCGSHSWYSVISRLSGANPKQIVSQYGDILSLDAVSHTDHVTTTAAICNPPGDKNFRDIHFAYLENRGFDAEYIIHKYDLRVTKGIHKFPFRIIVPIIFNGRVVSYQGRSYINSVTPKYLTCPPEEEVVFHKNIFFNLDNSIGSSVIIVEGVFDVFKLGSNTIASFGTAITSSQLLVAMKKYKRVFVLYDNEEEAQKIANKAAYTLSSAGLDVENICLYDGDPGDLSEDDALHLKKELGVI